MEPRTFSYYGSDDILKGQFLGDEIIFKGNLVLVVSNSTNRFQDPVAGIHLAPGETIVEDTAMAGKIS